MRKLRIILLTMIIIVIGSTFAFAEIYFIVTEDVNLYNQPGKEIITTINAGYYFSQSKVEEQKDNWFKIDYEGQIGWINNEILDFSKGKPQNININKQKDSNDVDDIDNLFLSRNKAKEIVTENAKKEWGNDYEMVEYTIENQMSAYDWLVKKTEYIDILIYAKNEWNHDYEMIKYEYENQVAAYKWIQKQTEHLDILETAKAKWGNNYEMVKYEYEKQVQSYENTN